VKILLVEDYASIKSLYISALEANVTPKELAAMMREELAKP